MSPADDASHPRLVGDVGGTHARFGWIEAPGAAITNVRVYLCREHAGLDAAIERYLAEAALERPRAAAIGVATPVAGDVVSFTNLAWSFSIAAIRERFDLGELVVLNDFAAVALAIPGLGADAHRGVGGGTAVEHGTLAVLGPGTGLGVGGAVHSGAGWVPIVGEGGHATLAADDAIDERLLALLREELGHVSAERVLSGQGLVNLHRAHALLDGEKSELLGAPEIVDRAIAGSDARCVRTVERFFGFLGSFAGNLALTLGASGGVYIAGGIVPRFGDRIDASPFRARFENKGRFRAYLSAIPTRVIAAPADAALRGANQALDDALARRVGRGAA
ncbi:glucokinase [Piscinibacter koreensis]|uniref:glucokinase n=1 Tax=Piscinibacter koreensis TaxID=2742824 RepID=UPI003158F675